MNYTIISTKDYQTGQVLDIIKNGNTYNVGFTNGDTFITKCFRTKEDAKKVYNEILNNMVDGWFTFELRAEVLLKKED